MPTIAVNRFVLVIGVLCSFSLHAQSVATLTLKTDTHHTVISRNIYGQFAEHLGRSIYDGFYRGGKIRMDIVEALRQLNIPNLRWPGGCFADEYHWRDGIGPKASRPKSVNTNWGMVTEDNSFGTHEFLELCNLLRCEPYIAGNVGSGTPGEMDAWLEYLNFGGESTLAALRKANGHEKPYQVSLWGVGNESWGCGGDMTPEHYADLYKQYAMFCHSYPGAPLKKIMSGANSDDYHWTEVLMKNVNPDQAWGYSIHYYTLPSGDWDHKGSATSFSEAEYARTLGKALRMEELVDKHSAIMDKYDPEKRIALLVDEWGVWNDPEPGTNKAFMFQQSSLRDALVAASTLNIFNNHCSRVRGANLAQTVNVIHSLVLTQGDQLLLTPTYYVFLLYKVHQDASWIPVEINSPLYRNGADSIQSVNASASIDSSGQTHISLVNLDPNGTVSVTVKLPLQPLSGKAVADKAAVSGGAMMISGQVLTADKFTDINRFGQPATVSVKPFTGFKQANGQLTIQLPAKSVVVLALK